MGHLLSLRGFVLVSALVGAFLVPAEITAAITPAPPPTCPHDGDGAAFAPSNPEFLGLVGNELQIAVALNANLSYLAQQYRQAGVGHVRVSLPWHLIEGSQGEFEWGFEDLRVSAIADSGLRTLGILGSTPAWAAAASCPCPPPPLPCHLEVCPAAAMGDYLDYVAAAVLRYGPAGTGQIRDWEIRVESNSVFGMPFTKEDYVAELNAAYDLIHQLDPDARVWGPEVVFHANNSHWPPREDDPAYQWVEYVIEYGNFDVFSIHHFESTYSAYRHTQMVRALLDSADVQVPLAVTAMNVSVPDPPSYTEAQQAASLRDMYVCTWAAGAEYAMWFAGTQWHGSGNPDLIRADTVYGVFKYDLNNVNNQVVPRQAYSTLRWLGARVGPLPPGEPYGAMGVSANPCDGRGADQCSVALYWYSTGLSQGWVQVREGGQSVGCTQSNRTNMQYKTLTPANPTRTFTLYAVDACNVTPAGEPLAQVTVEALFDGPTPAQ